jgi:hypothetical protein
MSTVLSPSRGAPLVLPRWLPLILILAVAVVLRHVLVPNSDVSWDLTIADKMIDGQRLYVDIIEVNPPATVYLYMLPALLGRWTGMPAELFVDMLVFAAAGLSLWLSSRVLARADILPGNRSELAAIVAAVLLILPAHTFGEREHIVLILFLPLLAVAVLRGRGRRPDLWMAVLAGICGGGVAIIKPFFAIPIVCVALSAAYFSRGWRPIFALENWIAAGLLAAYTAWVAMAFPEFFSDVLPLVLTVYVPAKMSMGRILIQYATPLWLCAWGFVAFFDRRALFRLPVAMLLAASIGFAIAFYIQQKGWPYQSYPMIALALIAFVPAFLTYWRRDGSGNPAQRKQRMAVALAVGLLVGSSFSWMNSSLYVASIAQAVRALNPHPKLLALSIDLSVGFPLTREAEGTWVGRVASLWISGDVWYRRLTEDLDPETLAKLKAYAARDRQIFTEDLARGRPDILLVDHRQQVPWADWIRTYPPLADQMKAYRKIQTLGQIDILCREHGCGPANGRQE